MSTHNICIRREIRKILCGYPLLSVAMGGKKYTELPMYMSKAMFSDAAAYNIVLDVT